MHPTPYCHHPSLCKLNACTSSLFSTSYPFLSHHPLHPCSSLFITRSWVVEEGSLYIVFGFPWFKSFLQSGWEGTGEASRHLWAAKGAVDVLNGLRALRGPLWCDGMKYNKPGFTHLQSCGLVVLFEGCISLNSLHISWAYVCVLSVAGSVRWGACFEHEFD